MNWQKNTGVMPCRCDDIVSTRYKDGSINLPKVRATSVIWESTDVNHTYYIHKVDDIPENDYVEPKVWTVEFEDEYTCRVKKNGAVVYTIGRSSGSDDDIHYLLYILNEKEERNGTH